MWNLPIFQLQMNRVGIVMLAKGGGLCFIH